jgi:hypothetical protein
MIIFKFEFEDGLALDQPQRCHSFAPCNILILSTLFLGLPQRVKIVQNYALFGGRIRTVLVQVWE